MPKIGLSLGSNLGDRLANLSIAVRRLEPVRSSDHFLVSSVYETDPVGCPPGSPSFYNATIEIETELTPLALLEETQRLEIQMGREEDHEKNAPRPIDIDLLYYGDLVVDSPDLALPHPRMYQREFVLRPLREIRPDLVSEELLSSVSNQEEKVAPIEGRINVPDPV